MSAGPTLRDRSHIDDTLRLTTAEPSAEVSGEDQRHHLIDKRQYVISLLEMRWKGKRCPAYIHSYMHTYSIHAHGQLKSHRIKKWMFSDNIAVLPTISSPRSSALKWKKLQNVYNQKEKTDVFACEWKEVWDNFSWGFSAETIIWKLLHDVQAQGLLCVTVFTVCVRVWACRHVSKRVINQSKSVTLSSPWKHLCSLEPHWFISERCCSRSKVSKSPRLDSINFMRAIHHALPKQLF